MSHVIAGRLDDLPAHLRDRLGIFRHRIFVQRLHWEIPGVSHDATAEWDEFDSGHTVHLVALSEDGDVCGCARLMPTTGPYLLHNVFPELAGSDELPASPSVWEMSRFAGTCPRGQPTQTAAGMSLFPYSMALARSFNATQLIGVVSRTVARLYRRYGLDLHDIGTATSGKRTAIVACTIDLESASFARLGCNADILLDSIRCVGAIQSLKTPIPRRPCASEANTHRPEAVAETGLAMPCEGNPPRSDGSPDRADADVIVRPPAGNGGSYPPPLPSPA